MPNWVGFPQIQSLGLKPGEACEMDFPLLSLFYPPGLASNFGTELHNIDLSRCVNGMSYISQVHSYLSPNSLPCRYPHSRYSYILERQSNIKCAMASRIKFTFGPCTMSMSVLPRDWRRALSSQSGSCKKGGRQQVHPLGYTMVDGNTKFKIPITQLFTELHTLWQYLSNFVLTSMEYGKSLIKLSMDQKILSFPQSNVLKWFLWSQSVSIYSCATLKVIPCSEMTDRRHHHLSVPPTSAKRRGSIMRGSGLLDWRTFSGFCYLFKSNSNRLPGRN